MRNSLRDQQEKGRSGGDITEEKTSSGGRADNEERTSGGGDSNKRFTVRVLRPDRVTDVEVARGELAEFLANEPSADLEGLKHFVAQEVVGSGNAGISRAHFRIFLFCMKMLRGLRKGFVSTWIRYQNHFVCLENHGSPSGVARDSSCMLREGSKPRSCQNVSSGSPNDFPTLRGGGA